MAASTVSRTRKSIVVFLISIAALCSCSALAVEDPVETVDNALFCFNNKFIFKKCNEEYRLKESGDLKVPFEETNRFCNGHCLAETQGLLDCIDDMVSDFVFDNKATTRDIRKTLLTACSYNERRGDINVWDYIHGETSGSHWLHKPFRFYAFVLMAGCVLWIF
ncbi:XIAP-associated factor like [Actinidia chinensis var. chinensis]|uniref:XIAP-associated factor like n=1 Tax=Actinidia chinensis var. chinensis TaxID=1590841 RepID=A0A2R6RFT1_ACTCC|nr:XIAP-associated factor like [Actinidia chinensis var. chinensis]